MRNLEHISTVDLQIELTMRTALNNNRNIPTAFVALVCLVAAELGTQQRLELSDVLNEVAEQLELEGFVREDFLKKFSPIKLANEMSGVDTATH